jgi:hypothetical protein
MPALVDALAQKLEPLVQAIAAQLPQKAPLAAQSAAGPTVIDETKLIKATDQLTRLLEEMDSEASDWITANAELFLSAYPQHFTAIREAVEQFEFEDAAKHLRLAVAAASLASG